MRRAAGLLTGLALGVSLAACTSQTDGPRATATLEASRLGEVPAPAQTPEPPPPVKFTRAMYASAKLDHSISLIDLCRGPVAIDLGSDRPVLVAEHDYCGGSDWISKLEPGEAVKLSGHGIDSGTYVVTDLVTEKRNETRVGDLPAADVVLQTCISPGELVLVAANRFESA